MLNVDCLTVYRGPRLVLEDLTFALRPGEVTAVLGLNGAGKTTLLKAILGLLPKARGSVTADGQPLDRLSPAQRAKRLSYVPQQYGGGFRGTAEDFVSMGATASLGLFSRPGRAELRRAGEVLSSLGCGHLTGRPMDRLSAGEQRMAYLARAVLQNAGNLLLDEPVSSLDLSRQHSFLSSLRRHVEERRAGCLLTIHAPQLAYTYAHRILLLHRGRLLLDAARSAPNFHQQLEEGLTLLYGPALRVGFQGGAMVLGWDGTGQNGEG